MKLTCTWTALNRLVISLHLTVSFWPFPLLPRIPRIDSFDWSKQEKWTAALPVKTNRFVIYYRFIREWYNLKLSLWHIGKANNYIKNNNKKHGSEPKRPGAPNGHWHLENVHLLFIYYIIIYLSLFINTFNNYCSLKMLKWFLYLLF